MARHEALPLRLLCFTALAAYAAAHWAGLVANPPVGRTLAQVAVVAVGAAVLGLLGHVRLPRAVAPALGALASIAMLVAALGAAGLPLRLLAPGRWGELGDGLHRGLEGVQTVDWPYTGPDEWVRLTIQLGSPALLVAAAVLAFFPVRRGARALRLGGLVTLLFLYGTAVTEHAPAAPLLRGFVLLVLVGAWLWLPRMAPREAAAGAAVLAAAGLLSVPVAAALDAERPWWNYRDWEWFGQGRSVTFNWTHSYGPLDWPREGTTLLNVKSDRPHYWKVETLDGFDGFRWLRTPASNPRYEQPGLPARREPTGRRWSYYEWNPRWDVRFGVTVRSLSSQLVVGAGITYDVNGAGGVLSAADGTTIRTEEKPLERGDSYTVRAYAPDPTAAQMRGAPAATSSSLLQYTTIALPHPGESALDPGSATVGAAYSRATAGVPLRDTATGAGSEADAILRTSAYDRAYALAQRLTAGQRTTYDAVKAVENHLQRDYRYSERPPSADVPLEAFLFEDRIGYCQQFSGAMALLLRMAGIPARVAAGFSPGSYNRDTREYRVRDLDAHSWVEVYFEGIGWVPFDPTPTAAPAESQSSGLGATSAARADAGEVRSGSGAPTPERTADGTGTGQRGRGGGPGLVGARAARRGRRYRARRVALGQVEECTRRRRRGGGAARRASPRAHAARLRPARRHHAPRARAAPRPPGGSGIGSLCGGAARAPLRPARARRARSGRAPGPATRAQRTRRAARSPARPAGDPSWWSAPALADSKVRDLQDE